MNTHLGMPAAAMLLQSAHPGQDAVPGNSTSKHGAPPTLELPEFILQEGPSFPSQASGRGLEGEKGDPENLQQLRAHLVLISQRVSSEVQAKPRSPKGDHVSASTFLSMSEQFSQPPCHEPTVLLILVTDDGN